MSLCILGMTGIDETLIAVCEMASTADDNHSDWLQTSESVRETEVNSWMSLYRFCSDWSRLGLRWISQRIYDWLLLYLPVHWGTAFVSAFSYICNYSTLLVMKVIPAFWLNNKSVIFVAVLLRVHTNDSIRQDCCSQCLVWMFLLGGVDWL